MKKKCGTVTFGIVLLATSVVFTFSAQVKEKPHPRFRVASVFHENTMSEHAYYSHLFHHIAFLNRKADEQEQLGRDGESLRSLYRREVGLSDRQSRALDSISRECVNAVAQQDKKAKQIIDQFRAQHPGGKIPEGVKLPPPPSELQAMQEERNRIISEARNRLRSALGEEGFSRLDSFVKSSVTLDSRPPATTIP